MSILEWNDPELLGVAALTSLRRTAEGVLASSCMVSATRFVRSVVPGESCGGEFKALGALG